MNSNSEKYFSKVKQIYGEQCNYNNSVYTGNKKPIIVRCTKHNYQYNILAHNHLKNKGCPLCRKENHGKHLKGTLESFLNKCEKVHGDFYDYSKVVYKGYNYKVIIKCPIHGDFSQIVKNHLDGSGCPQCGNISIGEKNKLDFQEKQNYIEKLKIIHNNKYDYSESIFNKVTDNIKIVCPLHGEFYQTVFRHKKGQGCKKCGFESIRNKSKLTINEFIERSNKIFNNKYDYSLVHNFCNIKERVDIICPTCGTFKQFVEVHIRGHGCPNCFYKNSKWEIEIKEYLNNIGINDIKNDKNNIRPYEIDLFSTSYNIGIECNGNYWHSEIAGGKSPIYHLRKTKECENKGIELIHIFEDEWKYKKDIVKSILSSKFKKLSNKIYARKTVLREISKKEKNEFLEKNHIFGKDFSQTRIGLFYKEELVSVMTFIKQKNNDYILNRFSNKIFFHIPGAANKLFNYFLKNYNPEKVKTLADNRWSRGNVYKIMGFDKIEKRVRPTYTYTKNYLNREHKQNYRRSKLSKKLLNFDEKLSEKENMFNNGYDRIWDCGHTSFLWKKC